MGEARTWSAAAGRDTAALGGESSRQVRVGGAVRRRVASEAEGSARVAGAAAETEEVPAQLAGRSAADSATSRCVKRACARCSSGRGIS